MLKALPEVFCQDGQYFRECFKVSKKECLALAKATLSNCIQQYSSEIPDNIATLDQVDAVGHKLGGCAGESYVTALQKKNQVIQSDRCHDPKAWM